MKVMMIAGEASGDMHGAHLVEALKAQAPKVECFGIGGAAMRKAGVDLLFDANEIAVVGFVEVLKHFGAIRRAWRQAKDALIQEKPDLLILIDYPGFNLRFAKIAKQYGIKVLFYISPQIWAWKQRRVYKIKQLVDHMAVIFPFEVPFYKRVNVPVTFIGSPLIESTQSAGSQTSARKALGIQATPLIGLLPGSRHSELTRLLPVLLQSAEQLQQYYPAAQFLLPIASTLSQTDFADQIATCPANIQLIENQAHTVMEACDVLIGASGTATLEAAILGTPMIIIYKTNALTFWLAKRLVKLKNIGLCNIVAGKTIDPELIQDEATPENIVQNAQQLLDPENNQNLRERLKSEVKTKLGKPGASTKLAKLAIDMIQGKV